jgi:23S rRNA G2069 N7-methylase RlmK/C1962 C5-methylase RlmI
MERITIEQYGAVLVLQNNDNTAWELVEMFRAALLAAGFLPEIVDKFVPEHDLT